MAAFGKVLRQRPADLAAAAGQHDAQRAKSMRSQGSNRVHGYSLRLLIEPAANTMRQNF
jgi:hypothetical protein